MSGQLGNAIDFSGRLSFSGLIRLERKLLLIGALSIVGPIFLLMIDAPPLLAGAAALLLTPVLIGAASANVRRLHDVGRHAHRVHLKRFVSLIVSATPVSIALASPGLPEWALWSLVGLTAVALIASFFIRDLTWTEWRRGDSGPNRFGPAPD